MIITRLGLHVGRAHDAPLEKLYKRQWLGRLWGCLVMREVATRGSHRPAV